MFLGILLVYGVCLVYLGWFDFEWCEHRVRPLELLRLLLSWCFPSFLLCDPGLPWCPIGSRSMLIRFRYMNKLEFSDIGFSTFSKIFFLLVEKCKIWRWTIWEHWSENANKKQQKQYYLLKVLNWKRVGWGLLMGLWFSSLLMLEYIDLHFLSSFWVSNPKHFYSALTNPQSQYIFLTINVHWQHCMPVITKVY